MAAPTNAARVKKALANSEPSTHGPSATSLDVRSSVANGGKADEAQMGHVWTGAPGDRRKVDGASPLR